MFLGCSKASPPQVVEVPWGSMKIDRLEVAAQFPPGCTATDANCVKAKHDEPILIVWMLPVGDEPDLTGTFGRALTEVSIGDGTTWSEPAFSAGMRERKYYYAFILDRRVDTVQLAAAGRPPVTLRVPAVR
jgi:hypothetical protein